jgi:hypothetical protein
MMPLQHGGVRITVQRTTQDEWGDSTYTDHHQIDGCVDVPLSSAEAVGGGPVTDRRMLLAPPASDVLVTDRVLIHPPGVDLIPADAVEIRRAYGYQVTGRPVDWLNPLTGWNPGMEVRLEKVT